ncbi:GIY-YIG nuclease family protein [Psychroserpens sp. MEBiC05023]
MHSYYTGITSTLDKRIKQHQFGTYKNCYTYKRRPLELKFYQVFNDVLQAIYYEKKIKGWTRAKKTALIENDSEQLQLLSECRNSTHYKYK